MGKSSIFSKSADLRKVIILSKLGKGGQILGVNAIFTPNYVIFYNIAQFDQFLTNIIFEMKYC